MANTLTHLLSKAKASGLVEDRNAFYEACVDHFSDKIHSVVFSFFKGDTEDLVQSFFLSFIAKKKLDYLPTSSRLNFEKYVFKMVRNFCIDHYKKHKNKKVVEYTPQHLTIQSQTQEDWINLQMDVEQALQKLKRVREREALRLFLSGKRYKEIALQMNTTERGVKNLIYRARNQLKIFLE